MSHSVTELQRAFRLWLAACHRDDAAARPKSSDVLVSFADACYRTYADAYGAEYAAYVETGGGVSTLSYGQAFARAVAWLNGTRLAPHKPFPFDAVNGDHRLALFNAAAGRSGSNVAFLSVGDAVVVDGERDVDYLFVAAVELLCLVTPQGAVYPLRRPVTNVTRVAPVPASPAVARTLAAQLSAVADAADREDLDAANALANLVDAMADMGIGSEAVLDAVASSTHGFVFDRAFLTPEVQRLVVALLPAKAGRWDVWLDPVTLSAIADALEEAGMPDNLVLRHLRGFDRVPNRSGWMPSPVKRFRGDHVVRALVAGIAPPLQEGMVAAARRRRSGVSRHPL